MSITAVTRYTFYIFSDVDALVATKATSPRRLDERYGICGRIREDEPVSEVLLGPEYTRHCQGAGSYLLFFLN